MNIVLWIFALYLAGMTFILGVLKIAIPKTRLAGVWGFHWVADFDIGTVRLIGVLEIVGAAALTLPPVFDVGPALVPIAALGYVLLMAAASNTHRRRGEYGWLMMNGFVCILALTIAIERFGPYSF